MSVVDNFVESRLMANGDLCGNCPADMQRPDEGDLNRESEARNGLYRDVEASVGAARDTGRSLASSSSEEVVEGALGLLTDSSTVFVLVADMTGECKSRSVVSFICNGDATRPPAELGAVFWGRGAKCTVGESSGPPTSSSLESYDMERSSNSSSPPSSASAKSESFIPPISRTISVISIELDSEAYHL
jgi:hypothetical protein